MADWIYRGDLPPDCCSPRRQTICGQDSLPSADAASFRPLDGPYASDKNRAYWMGKVIDGADPASFRVLNAAFECSADAARAYYRQTVIAGEDPRSFPQGRAVTNCTETSISFAE